MDSATHPAGIRVGVPRAASIDWAAFGAVLFGLSALYGPTFYQWFSGGSAHEPEGRELLVLCVSASLLWWRRGEFAALPPAPMSRAGIVLLAGGLVLYVVGRTFDVLRIELVSLVTVAAALLLCYGGRPALKLGWFPLAFLFFAFPLPYELVLALTGPMKEAVSALVAALLHAVGYPVARWGVVLTLGQYQLLVVEACAGLQTMFTLEAMGLLYTHLMQYRSGWRNGLLAVLVVPIAFTANVVRVLILALVTFHLGDDAAQGLLHGFAGVLLFAVALALLMVVDGLLGRWSVCKEPAR